MSKAKLAWFCFAIAPWATFASALPPLDQGSLRRAVETTAKELQVPGAVVILRAPTGEFTFAYGTRALGGHEPVTLGDHIRIGSITKSWTGTVILQQVEEGKLSLTEAVSKFRPNVPNGNRITIEQLLDMRSGLFNYSETRELNETLDGEPRKAWIPAELLALAWKNAPYFLPGAGFHYSNTNTILLGLIAEKIDGKPLATIFQDRLFKPLRMNDTSFPDIHSRLDESGPGGGWPRPSNNHCTGTSRAGLWFDDPVISLEGLAPAG